MPYTEQDFVNYGARVSTSRFLEQLDVSVAMGRRHAAELSAMFPVSMFDEMVRIRGQVMERFDEQAEKKFVRNTGNVSVTTLIGDAKKFTADVIAAAANAYEGEPALADQFNMGGKVGSSVPKVAARLEAIIALATDHQKDLAAWGIDKAKLEGGKKILADLRSAGTAQEQAVKDLPPKTREVYALKGKGYVMLKQLSRSAKRVFAHDPTTAHQFSLDVLNRKGHHRAAPAAAPAPAAVEVAEVKKA